ncbi:DUF4968 domain-containing protein [Gillisia sp. M10.2A]|uniref:DUF4968 domain-containing protein n=1 Tax=Gillisia lutea TaxID=2909668 RepID=A0ABS9EIG6_9FLAO|nr:TIM-barrel domain-containing protein [Gillisia lutea]MCF4102568.1 DUF4968 domain-containing protein [Gillisia lutea]
MIETLFNITTRQFITLILGLVIFQTAHSQNLDRTFKSAEIEGEFVVVNTNDGQYRFKAYTPEIIETSFLPTGETFNAESHAVVLKSESALELIENEASVIIDSKGIDVIITKNPFQVNYFFHDEKIIAEDLGYSKGEEHEKISLKIKEYELLFGGGARALGMNRRGHKLELYNRADYGYTTNSKLLNYTLPIVLSSEKYMLHFDNAPIGSLDLDSEHSNTLTYETISGRKTYQLIVGDTWEEMMSNYTLLTGRQPLPPRWTLGNFSSRFGYHSQQEVLETINKFKEDSIPVDAVILDLYWFGHELKGTMGNLEFVKDSFPTPKKMISSLEKQGVKTVLITEPFILTTSKKWQEAVSKNVLATDSLGNPFKYDFYFGNTGLVDVFKEASKQWFWNIYKEFIDMGVAGWWGDLGEPEVHPEALQHVTGTANETHNIYGHTWAKIISEGYKRDFAEVRPFILMRAGAAGSQRFGLIPWSGDVSRSWGGLKSQSAISLQMGMQGLAYMHSDLGGFAGDLEDDELYVRWLQYGVFQPVFRPHAQEAVASEPVFKKAETKALAKKAVELRYALLPYNYTLSFKNHTTGIPLMRPLFFEENQNYKLYNISDTYLWGRDILVSTVTDSGLEEKEVYFPITSNWYDFYTGKKYAKGQTRTIQLEKDHIPTFIRGGAFIPLAKAMQNTEEYKVSALNVHFYFDEEVNASKGEIYNDDGASPKAFEKGEYELLHMTSKYNKEQLSFSFEKEEGANFKSEIKKLDVIIHNIEDEPKVINVDGKDIKFTYNQVKKTIQYQIELKKDLTTVTIKLDKK